MCHPCSISGETELLVETIGKFPQLSAETEAAEQCLLGHCHSCKILSTHDDVAKVTESLSIQAFRKEIRQVELGWYKKDVGLFLFNILPDLKVPNVEMFGTLVLVWIMCCEDSALVVAHDGNRSLEYHPDLEEQAFEPNCFLGGKG